MRSIASYSILTLIIFHVIGIVLFMQDPEASKLSYITILLTSLLVIANEKSLRKTLTGFILIFIGGYLIELVGVSTGILFGNYSYGTALGYKLFGVPILIGLNWVIVIRASVEITQLFKINNLYINSILAAFFATFLDFLIEPVAISYGFWNWNSLEIPIWNYICWFLFSILFSFLILKEKPLRNPVAMAVFFVWILFFSILQLI